MKKNVNYTEINLKSAGKELFNGDYAAKAFAVTFVYSNKGNFLIRGFWGETELMLKAMIEKGYRFYYQYSFYKDGKARFTFTEFWDKKVSIYPPQKRDGRYGVNRNKFEFKVSPRFGEYKTVLSLKRLPKRWIPEFNNL